MRNAINNLISKLDDKDDSLLISLLNIKLNDLPFSLSQPHFTQKELSMTESGLNTQIRNYLDYILPTSNKSKKAASIIKSNECYDCKFSVQKYVKYGKNNMYQMPIDIMNENNPICISCDKWKDKLNVFCNLHDDNISQCRDGLITDDVVKTKALINKLQRKIKQICAQ